MQGSFPPPPDPALAAAFFEFVRDHAARYGWLKSKTALTQRAVRIMLGIQDTPGAPVRRSDVMLLTQIRHPAAAVAEVLAAAGHARGRPPATRGALVRCRGRWPARPMRHELGTWLEIMRNGRTVPPRLKPRSDQTVRSQLAFALPALKTWATAHDSLREISRGDVLAVLPPSGPPRATTVQGLRSIFRALKASRLVFSDPTFRIHVPAAQSQVPPAIDLATLREALNSSRPARAAIAALLGFHAIRIGQPVRTAAHRRPRRPAPRRRAGHPARPASPRTHQRLPRLPDRDLASQHQPAPVHPRPQLDQHRGRLRVDPPAAGHVRPAHPARPHPR